MASQRTDNTGSTIALQVVCAAVFCLFSFLWLFFFQADVLAVAQHVLSGGQTHYNRTVGAVVMTILLLLLQRLVCTATKLGQRTHALTYFPSMLALAALGYFSQFSCSAQGELQYPSANHAWRWVLLFATVLWGCAVYVSKKTLPFDRSRRRNDTIRRLWINLLMLALMMSGVGIIGGSNAVYHFRTHAEVAILQCDANEALDVGRKSLETDEHLTMLRAYALSCQGLLGERLFSYPVSGHGSDILPYMQDSRSQLLIYPKDSLYKHLGGRPVGSIKSATFLSLLERDSLGTTAVPHYRLCMALIDRDLSQFVQLLPKYFSSTDSLPLHYREALVLCQHTGHYITEESLHLHDAAMEEDWKDFQELRRKYRDLSEQQLHLLEKYPASYWRFYYAPRLHDQRQ